MKQHRVRTARTGANSRAGQGWGRQEGTQGTPATKDAAIGKWPKVMNLITQAGFTPDSTRWGEVANNHSYIQKENTRLV